MSVHAIKRQGKVVGWQAFIEWGVDPATGKRRRRTKAARTRAEAVRLERQLEAERADSWTLGGANRVGDWLIEWLQGIKEHRKVSTFETWETVVRLRVMPYPFSKLKLRDATPAKARELIRIWDALPGAPRTKAKWFECLSAAFNAAVKAGEISRSPLAVLDRPSRSRRRPTVWTRAEWQTFVTACWGEKSRYADILLLLAYTGCRLSEVTGATEDQLDTGHGLLVILDGKTDSSAGSVALTQDALQVIERALKRQEGERPAWEPEARFRESWLLRNQQGHRISGRGVEEYFQALRNKLGLPYSRPHDLRHFIATEGLAQGMDLKRISALLRQSSVAVTADIYAHSRLSGRRADLGQILGANVITNVITEAK